MSEEQKGAILLELAIILPILLLLLAGIIQFGFVLNAKVVVNAAAYEAARAATLSDNPREVAARTIEAYPGSALPGWNFGDRLSASIDLENNDPGYPLKVSVNYEVPIYFPKIFSFSSIDDGNFLVTGYSIMKIEEKE